MKSLNEQRVVVAGGTGNVGTFIVRTLLERGATAVVPSRSKQKFLEFRGHLARDLAASRLDRLETFVGDVTDETQQIAKSIGTPDAVVASLGRFVPVTSLLTASTEDFDEAMNSYLRAHFVVARRFLPGLKARGGTYLFINGPLAFEPSKGWGAGLVSTATAAHRRARELRVHPRPADAARQRDSG